MTTLQEAAQRALIDAATSLETIGRLAGKTHYLGDNGERVETCMEYHDQVRGYAQSRAAAAREALAAIASEPQAEPDCWAILTPNGSRLVSPEEAKGRKDAYPLFTHHAPPVEQHIPTPEDIDAQDWAGMDGAIAYHLIERYSENWSHAARLMHAWRDANPPASEPCAWAVMRGDQIAQTTHEAELAQSWEMSGGDVRELVMKAENTPAVVKDSSIADRPECPECKSSTYHKMSCVTGGKVSRRLTATRVDHIPDAGEMAEQPGAVGLSDDDIEWPDTEGTAHSCVQEALSFGLNYDVIHRHMLSVMFKTAGACRAALATQPVAPGRSQHDADSAELRSLCKARDEARRERDALRAELAGYEAAGGHLSALVDDLRRLLAEAMRVMKSLHESATPDDGPDMDAIIPAGAFRQFVDDNAKLMHLIHISPHELTHPAATQGAKTP